MSRGLDIFWPREDCTRVPFELVFDPELYQHELDRIFSGPHWQYLALEQEIPNPGDYVTTYLGERRVVVNRGPDGEIHAFESGEAGKHFRITRHRRRLKEWIRPVLRQPLSHAQSPASGTGQFCN